MVGLKMKYFVLNPKSKTIEDAYAAASRAAMVAYASTINYTNPELAKDLLAWVEREMRATYGS